MRRRCAYLTMDDLGGLVSDAALSVPAMGARGWEVAMVPWRAGADWDAFDLVYIASPWDYTTDVDGFLRVLEAIDASRATLVNPLALVRWNVWKRYLGELEARGVRIVPTLWRDGFARDDVASWFAAHGAERVVVKPLVGASAEDVYVVRRPVADEQLEQLERVFAARPLLVQPYREVVVTEGERSLFFLGGRYSHAIVKRPAAGDFRTQEEHGAEIAAITASPALVELAESVLAHVAPRPVYARVDLIGDDVSAELMELELIEPSLYLRTDPRAAERLAQALVASM